MKAEILRCLKETNGYVSGEELGRRFGVSRTAVWKAIRQLEEEGCRIEAVRRRGYRLVESADLLSRAELLSTLSTRWAGQSLVFLDEVDSTNNEAKRLADRGAAHGTLVVADHQTAGKGRRGRSWSSPKGSGIWMSLLIRPDFAPGAASMLTLVAAMAVSAGIRETTGLDCLIKWPNDIVFDGKKVCGILTEMSTEEDCIRHVVIGIGINVNTPDFPEEIAPRATSLALASGHEVRRAALIDAVLRAWEMYYASYLKTLDMSSLKETYNERLVNCGREVTVLAPTGSYTGISRGIDGRGELLVEMADGSLRTVISGEVSVRGIYGYV